jgi:hypothetical protein
VAEGGALLRRYMGLNPYRGFESLSLRQIPRKTRSSMFKRLCLAAVAVLACPGAFALDAAGLVANPLNVCGAMEKRPVCFVRMSVYHGTPIKHIEGGCDSSTRPSLP